MALGTTGSNFGESLQSLQRCLAGTLRPKCAPSLMRGSCVLGIFEDGGRIQIEEREGPGVDADLVQSVKGRCLPCLSALNALCG